MTNQSETELNEQIVQALALARQLAAAESAPGTLRRPLADVEALCGVMQGVVARAWAAGAGRSPQQRTMLARWLRIALGEVQEALHVAQAVAAEGAGEERLPALSTAVHRAREIVDVVQQMAPRRTGKGEKGPTELEMILAEDMIRGIVGG